MNRKKLGSWGEEKAAEYLHSNGYDILDMNYSCRFGEIDIIARYDGYIVFTEVKLRKNSNFAEAREFVTRAKQERILTTAQFYLAQNETDLQPRFDVIEIYAAEGREGNIEIRHITDAFE